MPHILDQLYVQAKARYDHVASVDKKTQEAFKVTGKLADLGQEVTLKDVINAYGQMMAKDVMGVKDAASQLATVPSTPSGIAQWVEQAHSKLGQFMVQLDKAKEDARQHLADASFAGILSHVSGLGRGEEGMLPGEQPPVPTAPAPPPMTASSLLLPSTPTANAMEI